MLAFLKKASNTQFLGPDSVYSIYQMGLTGGLKCACHSSGQPLETSETKEAYVGTLSPVSRRDHLALQSKAHD